MKTVTLNTLRDLLAKVTHATPVGLVAMTTPDLRVTGNPYPKGAVKKLTRLNVMVGARHESSVQRQQAREGQEPTFVAAPRKWGVHISPALVTHKGEFFLSAQMNPLNRPRPIYLVPKGKRNTLTMVSKETLAPWLPERKDERESQGVVRTVEHRDFRLDSIISLTMNGEQYRVRA